MMIQVNYTDDRYDYVKDFMLETLIRSGGIKQFRRNSGWVRIGIDPIRTSRPDQRYPGFERRGNLPAPRGTKFAAPGA